MYMPWFIRSKLGAWLFFVGSAAAVALAIQAGIETPWLGAALGFGIGLFAVKRFLDRRRMRRLLTSGNVALVLEAWHDSLRRVPHSETMRPLVIATLLASHGMLDGARRALDQAKRGRAWEAALEHRLLLQTLISAFDGQSAQALSSANHLASLPIVPASPFMQARIASLRAAVVAFAKSFAHQAEDRDVAALTLAAGENPLVHWPMRYAAAVAYVDLGQPLKARELLKSVPNWPEDSVFHHFQRELEERL